MTEQIKELASSNKAEAEKRIKDIVEKVSSESHRIKELGNWPEWIDEKSLVERLPQSETIKAPGFDAGIACALDMIARRKQKLSAVLHAAYTPEAVAQVREEIKKLSPDSETCWWLFVCSFCAEADVGQEKFLQQLEDFAKLSGDSEKRKEIAMKEFEKMTNLFYFVPEFGDNVPFGTVAGCLQGAYIAGYPFAVNYNDNYGIYYIGTYHPSLGLENFNWSDEKDENGRAKSGPVHGSRQYIKCANKDELISALEIVKKKFANESMIAK